MSSFSKDGKLDNLLKCCFNINCIYNIVNFIISITVEGKVSAYVIADSKSANVLDKALKLYTASLEWFKSKHVQNAFIIIL